MQLWRLGGSPSQSGLWEGSAEDLLLPLGQPLEGAWAEVGRRPGDPSGLECVSAWFRALGLQGVGDLSCLVNSSVESLSLPQRSLCYRK